MRSSGLDGVSIQTSCGRALQRRAELRRIGEVARLELEQALARQAR